MRFPLDEVILLALSNIHKGTKSRKVGDEVNYIQMLSQGISRGFIVSRSLTTHFQ